MILHFYETSRGSNPIKEYIDSLPTRERVDGLSVLQLMEDGKMDQVYSKRWDKKVWEVYFYKRNRIFYAAIDDFDIYLLHACRKQKNKTEKKDKQIVEKRAKELDTALRKKLI